MSPSAFASLSKFKVGTGSSQNILGAGVEAGERRLLGLPVLTSSAVTAGSGLLVDENAIISAAGEVRVDVDTSLYFDSDSVALRALWRIGWTVVHPDRVAKFTVTDPT